MNYLNAFAQQLLIKVYQMEKNLQNLQIYSPLSQEKVTDMKALAHYIPTKLFRYHTERKGSSDEVLMSQTFDLPSFLQDSNRSPKYRRRKTKNFSFRTEIQPKESNKNMFLSQSPERQNNNSAFTSNLHEFIQSKKRAKQLTNVIQNFQRRLNEQQIERNTRSIQIQMQRRQTMSLFSKIQAEAVKRSFQSAHKRKELFQKVKLFTRDYRLAPTQTNFRNRKNSTQMDATKHERFRRTERISLMNESYFNKSFIQA